MRVFALALVLLLQDPPEVARARDRLYAAISAGDGKAATEAIGVIKGGDPERGARCFIAAMQKTGEQQRYFDRTLEDDHRLEARLESDLAAAQGGSDALPIARRLEKARDTHSTHESQLLHAEDTHNALREALFALGAGALKPVAEELEKGGTWQARADMAEALGRTDHADAARALIDRLEREPSELVQAAVLEAVAARGGVSAAWVKPAAARLDSRAWQARRAAARAMAAGGAKESVEPLVAAIAKVDGLLRLEYDAALKKLTKTDLGDPGRWPDWWSQNGEAFMEGRYQPPAPRTTREPGKTTFYGLQVKSTRVAFVLDSSKSMADPVVKGGKETRFEVVRGELKNLLSAMPGSARVNILFFSDGVEGFAAAPRPLEKHGREDAVRFIDSVFPTRRTNLFGGLAKALSFAGTPDGQGILDGIDTIYVLSDGEPTYGPVMWSNLAERVVRRTNRGLRVTVHAIAVGDKGELLKSIAAQSGGEYVQK